MAGIRPSGKARQTASAIWAEILKKAREEAGKEVAKRLKPILDGTGTTINGSSLPYSATAPKPGGNSAAVGTEPRPARADHVHPLGAEALDALQTVLTGAPIAAGQSVDLVVPFACELLEVTLLADQTGSVALDLQRTTYALYDGGATHPAAANSIVATSPPTITGGVKARDTTLDGWTTQLAAGEILRVAVSSAASITRLTVCLRIRRLA